MSLQPLTHYEEDQVLNDISYTRDQLKNDIFTMRKWLRDQNTLPHSRLKESDAFLRAFLVGCKGDMSKAQSKMKYYYRLRGTSSVLSDRNNKLQLIQSKGFVSEITLRKVLPNCSRVSLIGCKPDCTNKVVIKLLFKRLFAHAEYVIRHGNGISGREYFIVDITGFTLPILIKCLAYMKSAICFFQYAYPIRLGRIIFFNAPFLMEVALNKLIKPLLSAKLQKRVTITTQSLDTVFEFMDDIPITFGGKMPDFYQHGDEFLDEILRSNILQGVDDKINETWDKHFHQKDNEDYLELE